ncbi:MAG: deoxyribose-phosphate aldolase [Gemmatimonadota bacterium]
MSPLPPWLRAHAEARLGHLVDHTLLRPEATEAEIVRLCEEAMRFGFGTVCVNGQWVGTAATRLMGKGVGVVAVVGFPLGASGLAAKVAETGIAVAAGANEIDMVLSLGRARAGQWDLVRYEIAAVVEAASGRAVKVILETAALTPGEAELASAASLEGGAAFVKTSTGFHSAGGASVEMVQLLRRAVGDRAGVKASGGIRTADDARRMLLAGADRIGSSAAAGWGDAVGAAAPTVSSFLA